MHTTANSTEPATQPTLRDLQAVMIRVQIKALETLERLMQDQELTGNEKLDKAKATERNRQRMSATQTLIHCRTMQRELREKREQSHRIRQDERQAASKAPHQLATLRRLHKQSPDEYDNPDAASEGATGGLSASARPNEPEPRTDNGSPTNLNQAETPTAPHWPTSGQWHKEPASTPDPAPQPLTRSLAQAAERKRRALEQIKEKREALRRRNMS